MELLKEFSLEDKCSYLDDKTQTTHYKIIHNCSKEHSQELVERGYRRFGKMFFRPICPSCDECKSIKIDANNYNFSKSAKRIMKKNAHVQSIIQKPTLTQEHINIFEKYHLHMSDKKSWDYNKTTAEHYYGSFVQGHEDFGYEVLYFIEDRLIAVDLIDILENGISSIYFYYDPEFAHLSLGKFSLYNQIKYVQEANKEWIYLGYYVKECPSLSYKAEYTPFITLDGRPNENEKFIWT